MNMKKNCFLAALLALSVLLMSACGLGHKNNAVVTAEPAATPSAATPTPVPAAVTPTPVLTPTPLPTPAPTPTPIPATPSPAVQENSDPNLPRITKDPTGETVNVGGKCQFVTRYENAKWAEWFFVSPDGSRNFSYKEAGTEFPNLKIIKGYSKDLTLSNIPAELNGWQVYCKFSNDYGSVNSQPATITVSGAAGGTGTAAPAATAQVTAAPAEPAQAAMSPGGSNMITQDMAAEGVYNYCRIVYDWNSSSAESDSMYLNMGEETATEYEMVFRSYTGAFVHFYVDKASGTTRIVESVPSLGVEQEIGSINLLDYISEHS